MGFENRKKNLAHGKRSKGITAIHAADGVEAGIKVRVLRHKHFDTSVGYNQGTTQGKDNAIRALLGPQRESGTYYFCALIATFCLFN